MKLVKKIFIMIILITFLTGCSSEKTYRDNGIKITMQKGLFYKKQENATIYYENEEIFVIGIEEKYENLLELDINKSTNIEKYVDVIFQKTGIGSELIKDEELHYFTYEYPSEEITYYYVSTIHKSHKGFWVCNFVCQMKDKDKYHDLFIKWAKSIEFY